MPRGFDQIANAQSGQLLPQARDQFRVHAYFQNRLHWADHCRDQHETQQTRLLKGSSLPGVTGSYMLTEGRFGAPGSRRLNCLSDGSTLVEQMLLREQRIDSVRFRYAVWNYTSSKARPIAYGVGEFMYSAADNGRTHVRWTYSFQLNRHRFPGMLGGLGDYLFRISFLDRSYAAMMRGVLVSTKADSERPAGGG